MSAQQPLAGRGAPRGAGSRADILRASERLLGREPLHKLSVADIIEEAGVSRGTFYFYFGSKYAVIAAMLTEIMDEIYDVARPFIERREEESPQEALRSGIDAAAGLWAKHRAAMRAVSENWPAEPELRKLWLGIVERFTDAFAAAIERQRRDGLAPSGVDSRRLVAALLWAAERCFYVAGLQVDQGLGSEERAAQALYAVWHGAIYGGLPAGGPKRAPSRQRRS